MAIILDFRPVEHTELTSEERPQNSQCEIILFPGVRYERWEDVPPPAPTDTQSARKARTKKRSAKVAK